MKFKGHILKRIRYLRKFGNMNAGDLGGWIEHEGNLSHDGGCYIGGEAKVFGNAQVLGDCLVSGETTVRDNAIVRGDSYIGGMSIVGADTVVDDYTWIKGNSKVFFYSTSFNSTNNTERPKAHIFGECDIDGDTDIEATGFIKDSSIKNANLYGLLILENDRIG